MFRKKMEILMIRASARIVSKAVLLLDRG